MRNPEMNHEVIMKQDFLKRWTVALKTCCKNSTKYMSMAEKQTVIKQTATIALAAAKRGSTAWSRAILADHEYDQNICDHFLIGAAQVCPYQVHPKDLRVKSAFKRKLSRSKRSRGTKRFMLTNQKAQKASSVAKSIIKRQTQVLKRLMPGGETIDECCLIGEALDYIVSLKAQVDVMKELVTAAEQMKKL